jgi:hypothetical protein
MPLANESSSISRRDTGYVSRILDEIENRAIKRIDRDYRESRIERKLFEQASTFADARVQHASNTSHRCRLPENNIHSM